MLKKFVSLFFLCFSIISENIKFSNPLYISFEEISIDDENIVFSNNSGIFIIDSKNNIKKICDNSLKISSKILAKNLNIFVNTPDGFFKIFDYSGNLKFTTPLSGVSRSNIVFDKNTKNVFFSLVNQMIVCFSSEGELVFVNKNFLTNSKFVNQKLLLQDKIYFLNNSGLCISDKYTIDNSYVDLESKFSCLSNSYNFYISGKKVVFLSDWKNYFFDKTTQKLEEYPKNSFFVNGVLVKEISFNSKKFLQKNFRFFDDIAFAFNENVIAIIKEDSIQYFELNFNIKDVYYDNGNLVVFDGTSIRKAKIN